VDDPNDVEDPAHEWLLSSFDPVEAQTVADFLVDVVGLEREIKSVLCDFYAQPDRRTDFYRQFLHGRNLNQVRAALGPVLTHFGYGDDERRRFQVIVEARNLIAHQEPVGYEMDDWSATYWQPEKGDPMLIRHIRDYRIEVSRLTGLLLRIHNQVGRDPT
jgi:hypothetical protein